MAMFDSSARAAQSVGRLARVFWLSLPAALLGLAPAAWAQSYLPVGPQNNVPVATVTAGVTGRGIVLQSSGRAVVDLARFGGGKMRS